MKGMKKSLTEEYLYLDFSHHTEGCIFPLHTSVTLFLLSYCDCKIFKVCLVSQWTRLCELTIPLVIEDFLRESSKRPPAIPAEILELERKLGEPVRVHNDDKLRRQKLKLQKAAAAGPPLAKGRAKSRVHAQDTSEHVGSSPESLELTVAFSKLTVQETAATAPREPPHIRKAKASELPPLEHVFAEGLYFTLTDIVLLPCIHHFLVRCCPKCVPSFTHVREGPGGGGSPHPHSLPGRKSPRDFERDNNTFFRKMSIDRALRKQQQLNNLVYVVTNQAKPGDRIVDFCSGGGHVGIVLAHMLPSCQVTLIENKELSLIRAKKRSDELGLNNIWFIQANMEYFTGMFNIGVALHACGVATDMVIEHCVRIRASFVTCPCCYGFIQNTSRFSFPKSEQFKKTLSYKEHMILCRFADQTAVQLPPQQRLIGKQCMCLVDLDRARAAEERGYAVQVISMEPESCSPKNNMIVGVPV
uniref:Glutathione S-transferase C-terminal domain-containing protein n=1 Tax=Propithecus coquereli TaxID=379532 RepID=A0A2K6EP84_PROCO